MAEFTIQLKNEKIRSYHVIAWIFIVFNYAAAIFVAIQKKEPLFNSFLYILFPALLSVFLQYSRRPKNIALAKPGRLLDFPFLFMAIPWLMMDLIWVALAVIVVSGFHSVAMRNLVVRVNNGEVIYPSFPRRTIKWAELRNVVLKDGLLTIDLKNNKLMQQLTEEGINPVNEQEFNDFCRQQLRAV